MKTSNDPRHVARRLALQVLFAWEGNRRLARWLPGQTEARYKCARQLYREWTHRKYTAEEYFDYQLLQLLVKRIVRKAERFDELIADSAPEWPLDQIAPIDLIILRIAVAELTQKGDLPYKVVIDEAVELAKEFGGDNSSKFINGVLGTIVEKLGKVK
ncbi:transcription antitermination factor NusB [Patescibacteria group bacterium]|nr:transcription antitermination factor NusB [Patescibacteria group bacterium]